MMRFKRLLIAVFTFAWVLTSAWGAGTNPVPSVESFESYAVGFQIDGAQGWSLGDGAGGDAGTISDDAAILDALQVYEFAGGTYPINTAHDQVLKLAGDVTQSVDGPVGEPVLLDFMLLPLPRAEAPAAASNSHFHLYFDTNGVATIFHYDPGTTNTVWSSLTNAAVLPAQTWTRVTVNLDYGENMYQISIDEGGPIVDSQGWDGTTTNATQPGSWFHMPWTNGVMSSVTFEGNGEAYLDDLVIGGGLPLVETISADISDGSGNLNGFLSWTGFTDTAVSVYWGLNDGGTDPSAWDATNSAAAPQAGGTISIPISGAPPEVTHYYRFAAINAAGTNWASATKIFIWLEFPVPVFAETNFVPFAEPFEKYADGFNIEDAFGWFLGENADDNTGFVTTDPAIVNALTNYTAAGGSFPLPATHDKVLCLDGPVELSIASPPSQPVRTDMMLRPFFSGERPDLDGGDQLGLIFNTNGVAEIFHRNVLSGSNEWITLDNGPTIASQAWTRVTFYQDYSNHLYQVSINESGPISHPSGWTAGGSTNGPWFAMPNQRGHMLELRFEGGGEAYLDDVVVGGLLSLVETLPPTNVTAGAADMNGFLSYTGFAQASARIYYGLSDGMTVASAWDATNTLAAPQAPGTLSSHVSGLDTNRLYFYRYAGENTFGINWADTSEVFFAGAVNVMLVDPNASEITLDPASFKFTRAATATNADLGVNYSMGGTATNGDDYQALSGSVTIPAGATEVTVIVQPLRDTDGGEGFETVTVALLPGPYALGATALAFPISIQDAAAGSVLRTWDNDSGDRNWNDNSINWVQNIHFLDGDNVEFTGISSGTGRVYIGTATYTGSGFSGASASPVAPLSIEVTGGTYDFDGGQVAGGPTLISGGRLVDRRLDAGGFGSGPITLQGGELWRHDADEPGIRSSHYTNDIIIAAASLMNGDLGSTFWDGGLELKDRLTLNYLDSESTDFDHWFTGTLTLNQDTNFPNARIIDVHGRDGETRITGNIVDDPDGGHTGNWPLTIGSRKFSAAVFAGEIYISGTNNSYSTGTVIDFFGSQGNDTNGVTVQAGSKLGTGNVTVKGTNSPSLLGACLTLSSADAIDDDAALILWDGGKVIVPGSNQVEIVGAFVVDGDDKGFGTWGALDYPANIKGPGKIHVVFPQDEALMLILR